ncbi:MAG: hypothetical protein ABSE51_09045 [Terracidiphilus sp.]|jgi:hypothetical protein
MTWKDVPPGILNQRWLHSHEEDTADEMVFRPASFPFPPSRGRIGFELQPDGIVVVQSIAPTDGPQDLLGTWTIGENGQPQIALQGSTTVPRLSVASVTPDRLIVKK